MTLDTPTPWNEPNPAGKDLSQCTWAPLQTHVYDYSWEQVISSYMLRFPKHPRLPVLLNSEVLEDQLDIEQRKRRIVRQCFIDIEAPNWFKRTLGLSNLVFLQTTEIDFQKQSMKIFNINVSFKDKAIFGDQCEYRRSDKEPTRCYFEQRGFFQLPRYIPMAKTCEKIMCKNYEKHCGEGRHIDAKFTKEAIDNGHWQKLAAGGELALVHLKVEYGTNESVKRKSEHTGETQELDASMGKRPSSLLNVAVSLIRQASISSRNSNKSGVTHHSSHHHIDSSKFSGKRSHSHKKMAKPEFVLSNHLGALSVFVAGLAVVAFLPSYLSIDSTTLNSLVTVLLTLLFLFGHHHIYGDFWHAILSLHSESDVDSSIQPEKSSSIFSETPKKAMSIHVLDESKTEPISSHTHDNNLRPPIPNHSPDQRLDHRMSFSADYSKTDDEGSSDGEEMEAHLIQEDEEDEFEDEALRDLDEEDIEDFFQLSTSDTHSEMDGDLGDLSAIKLREIKINIPVFWDKSLSANGLVHFIVEVKFPNGARRVVERQYTDFVRLKKYFTKIIPQCKVQLPSSLVPKKKNNQPALGMALDQRRLILEQYLRGLLMDEAVAKLGHRVLIEFLKYRGMLFSRTQRNASHSGKKRFFSTSFNNSSTDNFFAHHAHRHTIFMKVRWKSSMKDVHCTLDLNTLSVNMFCDQGKEPHCSAFFEEIEDVIYMNEATPDFLPILGEKFHFMEIRLNRGCSWYLGSNKDTILDWIQELNTCRQPNGKQLPPVSAVSETPRRPGSSLSRTSIVSRLKKKTSSQITSGQKVILNHKRILFDRSPVMTHPCEIASNLLNNALDLFQEFTDSKCVLTPKVVKRLRKFGEQTAELQNIDLSVLTHHAEKLSFQLNIFHTLVIHSHLDMGFGPAPSSSKRLRLVFRAVCYDIGDQLFSIQDIEHSILRAKMSRPIMMNNSFLAQVLTPRFNKKDPRNRWAIDRPDLRINFVLNSGTKSSIYNIWPFVWETELLNQQLDHASTHFLNEQVAIDFDRNIIYLPRICQYYSNDLGGSKTRILKTLMQYMSPQMEKEVKWLYKQEKNGGGKVKLRYNDYDWAVRGVFFRGHLMNNMDQITVCRLGAPGSPSTSPTLEVPDGFPEPDMTIKRATTISSAGIVGVNQMNQVKAHVVSHSLTVPPIVARQSAPVEGSQSPVISRRTSVPASDT